MTDELCAIGKWKNNAEMFRDIALSPLPYLGRPEDVVLDPTYGHGRFYKLWSPEEELFFRHDIEPDLAPDGVMDFTDLQYDDDVFDIVIFDPPYKLNGTGGEGPGDEAYGVDDTTSSRDRLSLIDEGLEECLRVLRPSGYLLYKTQNMVSSGKQWWLVCDAWERMMGSAKMVDVFHLVTHPRKQPEGRRQMHARSNYSSLMVFRKRRA